MNIMRLQTSLEFVVDWSCSVIQYSEEIAQFAVLVDQDSHSNFLLAVCFILVIQSVDQRNGDGEAKSPACRAGVCEAVLHTSK